MRKILLLALVFVTSVTAFGQDQSNKGKDFWFAYPAHNAGTTSRLAIYLTSDVSTSGTVTFNGNTIPFSVTANQATIVKIGNATIPSNASCYIGSNNVVEVNKGIHIQSVKAIAAYAHILNSAVSGSTLLLPVNVLGKEYVVSTYVPQGSTAGVERCQFVVVGVENNTTVEITPINADVSGAHPAGIPYQIVLNKGDVYQFQSFSELAGSIVKSIAVGASLCRKIVVIGSTTRSAIGCVGASSGDNLFQQLAPKNSWGRHYLTAPFILKNHDIIRVYVSKPLTPVNVNGTDLPAGTLINNSYYEFNASIPQDIISTDPISVYQYIITQNCDGVQSDPEMVLINSIEQTLNDITFVSAERSLTPPNTNITSHYVNVIIKDQGAALSSIKLDGATVPAASFTPIGSTLYKYARINLTASTTAANPSHRLLSDSGFTAIAYGFGNVESYGYNAGTNVIDLDKQLQIESTYGIENSPNACTNSPFKFKVYLPDSTSGVAPDQIRYDSMKWDVTNQTAFTPNNFPVVVYGTPKVIPDSVNTQNNRKVAWYSLPSLYAINAVGTYDITLTVYRTSTEGCGNEQEFTFPPLTVTNPPTASFNTVLPGCYLDSVRVTETTPQTPKATYKQWWEFYDPVTNLTTVYSGNGLRYKAHLFTTSGTIAAGTAKRIRHASITTPGCLSDTIVQIIELPKIPDATLAGGSTLCINTLPEPFMTFTAIDGRAPYIFTYNIDNGGGPGPNIDLPSLSATITLNVPTTTAGTFTYRLVGIRNDLPVGTPCTRVITGQSAVFTITPDATVTLRGGDNDNQTVCINNPIVNIRYDVGGSGNGGSVSGLPAGVTGTYAGGVITIIGTPTVPGTFTYTVSTNGPCLTPSTTGTINVNNDGTLTLSSAVGTDNQTLCINTALTDITYALTGGGTGGSVSGLPAGIIGVYAGGVITISGTPTVSGVFNYTVTTTGPCIKPTATGTITINADATITLTSAVTTNNQTVCINNPIVNITYAVGGGGTGGSVSGLPAGVTGTYAGGVITITGTPTAPGVFNYTVSTTGPCIKPQATGTINVTDDGTLTLTSSVGSDNQTLCINTPLLTNITYAVSGSGTGGSVSGLPAGLTGVFAGGVITISGTPTVAGVFNYTVTTTGPCIKPSATGSITVTGDGTLTLTSAVGTNNQTRCINVAITNITYAVGGTGTGGAVSGLPPGVNGVFAGGVITISGTPTLTGTYNYTVSTTGPCVKPTATGTITVNPDAAITLTSAVPTTSQELCRNSAITSITYAITGGGTGAGVTGLPAGVTGVYAGGVFTISGTPTVAGLFNYTVTTTGTCVQNSKLGTILVDQLPTASFTYTAPSCETRVITFSDGSAPNSGLLNSWSWDFGDASPTSALQNPTHVYAAAGTYNVTLTVTTDKGCTSNPIANVPVTINNRPVAGFIVPDVCINDVATPFTDTSKIAAGTINRPANQWLYGDPGSGALNNSVGINGLHLYTSTGVYQVRQIVTSNNGCKDTITLPITINSADPVSNFTASNPCSSDSIDLRNLSTVGFGSVTRLDIYWDFAGAPLAVQTISSPAFNGIYRHKYPTLQTTKTYTIKMIAYSGVICSSFSTKTVTVYATPRVQFNNIPNTCYLVPPYLLTQGSEIGGVPGTGAYSGPGITNPNGTFNPQIAGIGTHSIKYTWTASNAGACIDTLTKTIIVLDTAHAAFTYVLPACALAPVSFTDISTAPASVSLANTVWDFGDGTGLQNHAPGSTFTHTFTLAGTYTATMHNVSAVGCLSTDTIANITIDPNHTILLSAAGGNPNQSVCINTPITPILYTLGGGATGATVTGLPTGVTASVTGNILTISGTPTTSIASPYNFNVLTTGNACVVATALGIITVKPDHAIALNSSNDNQIVCINTPIAAIVYTLSGGATGATVTGLPPGVTASVSGNLLTIIGTPTSTAGSPYNFNISTTGNSCIVATAIGSIIVQADHTISLNGTNNNQTLCINIPITPIVYTLGGGANGATVTGLPAGITYAVSGNLLTISGAPTTTVSSPFIFNVITTGNTCVPANAAGVITVNPDHSISFTSGDTAQSVCINTTIEPIVYDLGGGATGVTIVNLPPGVTYTVVGTTLTISGTPTSLAGGPMFNFAIQTTGNACVKANTIGEILVNPYPVPDFAFDKTSYCIPNATVVFINNTTPAPLSNHTYAWEFGDGGFSTAAAPSHYYTSTGPFTVKLKARSTVLLNNGVIGCESAKTSPLNIIHPQPKADFVFSKASVCIGDNVIITDATDNKDGLPDKWNWDMGDGGKRVTNPVTYTYADTITYTITLYSVNTFGCNSDTISKPFSVYPYPYRNAGPDKFVLEGGSVELEATAFAREPVYSWTPVEFLTDSKILRPRVMSPRTDMTYRLTVTGKGGCQASDDVFVKLLKFPAIPNTFTPNGDGINDQWRIDYLNTYPNNRVQIFTRSGKLVFESKGYTTPWDGTLKGKPLPFDTYYYIIEPGNGRDAITGYVTIIK